MARVAVFTKEDFLASAAGIIAEQGPAAATTTAILRGTGAPAGSFYHRFASRDMLLGELWLGLVEDYQQEFLSLLESGDSVKAALFTPRWVRGHPQAARILLLYRRQDFVEKKWPDSFVRRAQQIGEQLTDGLQTFTKRLFGASNAENLRRVQFALIDVPLAAVRPHLMRNQELPKVVDNLVRETCLAVLSPDSVRQSSRSDHPYE